MKLESVGILISLRPFNERDSIAYIFTRDYGLMCGMMTGAVVAKKNKPLVGQVGNVSWNARLDSQLGAFHWEPARNMIAPLMADAKRLGFASSCFSLLCALLPEREKYTALFNQTESLINGLAMSGTSSSELYLNWEINLLTELGYALDLAACANCGRDDNLTYLSPRTGRAVCEQCAAPYSDKLYNLPVNLAMMKQFLQKILDDQGLKQLPVARQII